MKRMVLLGVMSLCLLGGTGCHLLKKDCGYHGVIDHIGDCEPQFDHFYRAGCDLNRIGKRDWCQSPLHRRASCKTCEKYQSCPYGSVPDAVLHEATEHPLEIEPDLFREVPAD